MVSGLIVTSFPFHQQFLTGDTYSVIGFWSNDTSLYRTIGYHPIDTLLIYIYNITIHVDIQHSDLLATAWEILSLQHWYSQCSLTPFISEYRTPVRQPSFVPHLCLETRVHRTNVHLVLTSCREVQLKIHKIDCQSSTYKQMNE